MKNISLIFRREWREALRDRRTILVMLLVPLVFYPLAMGAFGYFGLQQQGELAQRELRVGLLGMESLEFPLAGEGLLLSNVNPESISAALESGEYDLILQFCDVDEAYRLRLHYRNTVEGEAALMRVSEALERAESGILEEQLLELGGASWMADPLRIELIDHAKKREVAGSRMGGVLGYLLVFLGFTGCLATAVDTGAGEKERGVFEVMLASGVRRRDLILAKWLFVLSAGLLSMLASLAGLGGLVLLGRAGTAWSELELVLPILGGLAVLTVTALIFTSSLLVGISLLSQNAKQAQSYTSPLFLGISLALIFALVPGTELQGFALCVPILSVALGIREVIIGSLSFIAAAWIVGFHLAVAWAWLIWVGSKIEREGALLSS